MIHEEINIHDLSVKDFVEFEKKRALWLNQFKRILANKLDKIIEENELYIEKKSSNATHTEK